MSRLSALAFGGMLTLLLACASTAMPTPRDTTTPNIEATVAMSTPRDTTTPNIEATVQATPTLDANPVEVSLVAGTHKVGLDIQPGIYAGKAGQELFGSCYWARLSGVSGAFEEIITNENEVGQFYLQVLSTDRYIKTDCAITPIESWPKPSSPLKSIEAGTYIVGRDIDPGTYHGVAGQGLLDSCYWARLSGLSGDFEDLIANDNAIGPFYMEVLPTDEALRAGCSMSFQGN